MCVVFCIRVACLWRLNPDWISKHRQIGVTVAMPVGKITHGSNLLVTSNVQRAVNPSTIFLPCVKVISDRKHMIDCKGHPYLVHIQILLLAFYARGLYNLKQIMCMNTSSRPH